MAASPATSETLSHQQASSGPTIAPRPRDLSISTSASSPSGPPTPSSASSPSGCVPAIAIKPGTAPRLTVNNTSGAPTGKMTMASVMSPSTATQLTMTSKEWVIPPRPKPGRKPATDTPPTKRKAQNRAAQRAFRERRAARVGELEEELTEVKEEHKKREEELEERIRHLEVESETLRSRCQWLQSTLEKERLDRMRHSIRATPLHPQENGFGSSGTSDQVPVQSQGTGRPVAPRPAAQQLSISNIISPPDQQPVSVDLPTCGSCGPKDCVCASAAIANAVVGCGNCTVNSRCACLEAALEAETPDMSDLKRPARASSPFSSFMQQDSKRQRLDPEPTTPMEIDFTAIFSQKTKRTPLVEQEPTPPEEPNHHPDQPQISVELKDSCGFCSDGGYCVCAEAPTMSTPVTSSLFSTTSLTATAMPVSHQQQTHTPPPSEDDVVPLKLPPFPMEVTATGAIKLRPFRPTQPSSAAVPSTPTTSRSSAGCGPNGPGTCAQCIRDPVSGLFCRSLAANFERTSGSSGGCCGGASAAGGCCKSSQPQQQQPQTEKRKKEGEELGLSLPCAEAYRTLASHKHFDEAAGQIGEWLPRLKAAPAPVAGRQPYEVEAASIMSVLRGFDIRFGKGE